MTDGGLEPFEDRLYQDRTLGPDRSSLFPHSFFLSSAGTSILPVARLASSSGTHTGSSMREDLVRLLGDGRWTAPIAEISSVSSSFGGTTVTVGRTILVPRGVDKPLIVNAVRETVPEVIGATRLRSVGCYDPNDDSRVSMNLTLYTGPVAVGKDRLGRPLRMAVLNGMLGRIDSSSTATAVLLPPMIAWRSEHYLLPACGESSSGEFAALVTTSAGARSLLRWDGTTSSTTLLGVQSIPGLTLRYSPERPALCDPRDDGSWLVAYYGLLHMVRDTDVVSWSIEEVGTAGDAACSDWVADFTVPEEPMLAVKGCNTIFGVRWTGSEWAWLPLVQKTPGSGDSLMRLAIGRTSDGTPTVCFRLHRSEFDGDVYSVAFDGAPLPPPTANVWLAR
ncbi:hypothetical protein GC173_15375 [bacterium]|nr:hypothetical protein [bacterium]